MAHLQDVMRPPDFHQPFRSARRWPEWTIINRHAFVTVKEGVSKYFLDDGGVRTCCDDAPVEGRKYCKLVYVEQEKIGEPGVYYCTGQGTQKAAELQNKAAQLKTQLRRNSISSQRLVFISWWWV